MSGCRQPPAEEAHDLGGEYRALATKLHPDRGGSKEAMARLNRVRDELKQIDGRATEGGLRPMHYDPVGREAVPPRAGREAIPGRCAGSIRLGYELDLRPGRPKTSLQAAGADGAFAMTDTPARLAPPARPPRVDGGSLESRLGTAHELSARTARAYMLDLRKCPMPACARSGWVCADLRRLRALEDR
jgi:hypothetical protein